MIPPSTAYNVQRNPILAAAFVLGTSLALAALAQSTGTGTASDPDPSQSHARIATTSPQTSESIPHKPSVSAPRIATGEVDAFGRAVTVSCASCHANFERSPPVTSAAQLTEFHQGLEFAHGDLSCRACHHPDNYNLLRLADQRPVDFHQSRTLCSQCHAKQTRDYEHGAHGGMNGYWDLSRGSRQRKDCVDCHDPHAPAFPSMIPTFHPHDRFLAPLHGAGPEASEDSHE